MELLWLAEMDEGVTFACGAEAGERMERSVAEVRSVTKWNEGILPQAHGHQQNHGLFLLPLKGWRGVRHLINCEAAERSLAWFFAFGVHRTGIP